MDLLEKIRQAAETIAEMGRDALDALRTDVINAWEEIEKLSDAEKNTPEIAKAYTDLGTIGSSIQSRTAELDAADEQSAADRKAASDAINALKGPGEDGDEDDDEAKKKKEADDKAAAEAKDGEKVEEPAGIAASNRRTPSAAQMRNYVPAIAADAKRTSLVAAAGLQGLSVGTPFESLRDVGKATASALRGIAGQKNAKVIVASAEWEYPDDRRLENGATVSNTEKMNLVASARRSNQGFTASGGTPLPVNVDWKLDVWADADMPVGDSLDSFQATHGGLTFRTPINVGDMSTATTVWTAATDASPGESVKAVQAITIPSPTTKLVDAIATRVQFGNFAGQFDPDLLAENTEQALNFAARVTERHLLDLIASNALSVSSSATLGSSRSFLAVVDQVLAGFRFTNRLARTVGLAAIIPDWMKDVIRADRALELAHDGQSVDPQAIPDEWIESVFAVRGLKVTWARDGQDAQSGSGSLVAFPAQYFGAPTAAAAIPSFPTSVAWYLFIDGSIQRLDGGRLDLGVVRDATLDSTNDYETFVELFVGIAYRGFAKGLLQVVTPIVVTGHSAAAA